ncbi:hypothetical protein OAK06_02195 [Gammaproteobacteria bacterium]|nr:hypothetical protein [Gammaproteobacteria bacterium]
MIKILSHKRKTQYLKMVGFWWVMGKLEDIFVDSMVFYSYKYHMVLMVSMA